MKSVLIYDSAGWAGGSSVSLKMLLDSLDRNQYKPVLVFGRTGYSDKWQGEDVMETSIANLRNYDFAPGLLSLRGFCYLLKFIISAPVGIFRAKSILKKLTPDIVYINDGTGVLFGYAAARSGYKVIWHIRELVRLNGVGRWQRKIYHSCATKIVAISRAVAKRLISDDEIVVVSNAAKKRTPSSEEIDLFKKQHAVGEDDFCVLLLGSFHPTKGYLFLADVAEQFDEVSKVKFLLAGVNKDTCLSFPGSLFRMLYKLLTFSRGTRGEIRERWKKMVDAKVAVLTGYVDADVALAVSDLVVCPNTTTEPFGRTVIEAYCHGKPVVTRDIEAFDEIVEDGKAGYRLSLQVSEWVAKINELREDRDLLSKLGEQAFAESAKYGVPDYCARIESIFDGVE